MLLRSLASNLVIRGKILTTEAKAKELRPFIERMITKGRAGTVAERRLLASRIGVTAAKKLVDSIAPKYKDHKGGYTRIVKTPARKNDAAKMAYIEFV